VSPKVLELADIMRLEVKRPETIVEDIVPTPARFRRFARHHRFASGPLDGHVQ
jgi:hypothetical protein